MPASNEKISEINIPGQLRQVVFGEVVYAPGGTLGPRLQRTVQLVAVHRGWARVTLDGRDTRTIRAGEIGLLLPERRERFAFATDQRTHHSWCHLHYDTDLLGLQQALTHLPARLALSDRAETLIQLALALPHEPGAGENTLLVKLGEALLWDYLARSGGAGVTGQPRPEPLQRACHHIDQHLAEPISLAELAKAASVTSTHLIRLFRTHLHQTPMRYLWQKRTQRGIELLRDTGLTVAEIAYRVGFQSPFHFSRLVRDQTGQSPRTLRRHLWRQQAR